jgi:hypothetical protein
MELAKRLPELSPEDFERVANSEDMKAVADGRGLTAFLRQLVSEKPRLAAVCVAATELRTTPNCLCDLCVDTAASVAFGFTAACVAFDAMRSRAAAAPPAPCACEADAPPIGRELPKVSREDRDTVVQRDSKPSSADPRAYSGSRPRPTLADLRRAQPELAGDASFHANRRARDRRPGGRSADRRGRDAGLCRTGAGREARLGSRRIASNRAARGVFPAGRFASVIATRAILC